ncbi:MAG: hypothetical protein ACK559_05220 [bacterium]
MSWAASQAASASTWAGNWPSSTSRALRVPTGSRSRALAWSMPMSQRQGLCSKGVSPIASFRNPGSTAVEITNRHSGTLWASSHSTDAVREAWP